LELEHGAQRLRTRRRNRWRRGNRRVTEPVFHARLGGIGGKWSTPAHLGVLPGHHPLVTSSSSYTNVIVSSIGAGVAAFMFVIFSLVGQAFLKVNSRMGTS